MGFEYSPMIRLHLKHLLLIRVRVSELQNCEIGPVADFLSMKAFDDLLANLRRFEPVIRSERMDLIKTFQSRRPTLQTQPPDLFLESRAESSVRGLQNQGQHIGRVQPAPKRWVSRLGIRLVKTHQGFNTYRVIHFSRQIGYIEIRIIRTTQGLQPCVMTELSVYQHDTGHSVKISPGGGDQPWRTLPHNLENKNRVYNSRHQRNCSTL